MEPDGSRIDALGGTPELRLRAITEADEPVLREATLLNLNWAGARFTSQDVIATPQFRHYTEFRPERGDFGYLLADASSWVSVVWLLFLDHDDPGYGFVEDGIPELSLCTHPGHRGRGHGRHLLEHAIDGAHRRGHSITLSVESGNPARRLYEQVGFRGIPAAHEGTMLLGGSSSSD